MGVTRARAVMIQGTGSSVGKSLLCAALCRVFRQDGFRVAPFKAQNMSLNSFVTADGREIARAQVLQAQAAGVAPAADMNPLLLKPRSDTGCQVIVHGRPVGNLSATEYRRDFHRDAWRAVRASFDRLRRDYDVLVIEGAGSPAEVNLRDTDIVNMRVAGLAGAPVLLVGDVDRGGVLASLLGTLRLLRPAERRRVAGLVVNKFRGDRSLFDPAVEFLERRSGKPVLGVLPWIEVDLEEEDSLSAWAARPTGRGPAPGVSGSAVGLVDVAVLAYPHISNFTDLDALRRLPGVRVRPVRRPDEFGAPDAVVLPGSKNTVEDLRFLREQGLDRPLAAAVARGAAVAGLCGGYQMLGTRLIDDLGCESAAGATAGLGLLPVETVFAPEKRTVRVRGRLAAGAGPFAGLAGRGVEGYEIHHGRTRLLPGASPLLDVAGEPEGCVTLGGQVFGTYFHGLFDNPAVALAWVNWLRARKGLPSLPAAVADAAEAASAAPGGGDLCGWAAADARRERELDRLAAWARRHLRLDAVYAAMALERPAVPSR